MLWMALYFPALPLEIFTQGDNQHQPCAISQTLQGRELVNRCNSHALKLGIRPGQPIPAARLLCPSLRLHRRDLKREQSALETLALWLYQFSSRIICQPLMLALEIGASLRLFGGLEPLQQHLLNGLQELQHQVQSAIAPTPMAAALLARSNPGQIALSQTVLRQLIQPIPLSHLTRHQKSRDLIENIGLRSIGDCLALPRAELARRTHPQLIHLLDQLLGQSPDPQPLWQPPDQFAQKLELNAEIQHQHALIFPARRLIAALCGYLRGRGAGAQHLLWRLQHREIDATEFEQGLAQSTRDTDHILDIFRERIERLQLPQPVISIELEVKRWQRYEEQTLGLLEQQKNRAENGLLERLSNRLGETRVRGICSVADYRPEYAWRLCPPQEPITSHPGNPRHPLWLLQPPLPLPLQQGLPRYDGPLTLLSRAERLETGWWDDDDVARDYFVAENPQRERLWIFRDLRSGGWFLQGVYD